MAYADTSIQPSVVKFGTARINDNVHKTDGTSAYYKGQLGRKNASGQIIPIAAGNASKGVHVVILEDVAANTAAKFLPVIEVTEDMIFEAQVHHDTAASAVPAQALIGDQYRINWANNKWSVDLEQASNPDVEILDIYPNYADYDVAGNGGGQFGLVRVKILASRITKAPEA